MVYSNSLSLNETRCLLAHLMSKILTSDLVINSVKIILPQCCGLTWYNGRIFAVGKKGKFMSKKASARLLVAAGFLCVTYAQDLMAGSTPISNRTTLTRANNRIQTPEIELSETNRFVCPLTENKPHADLLAAVQNLSRLVTPVDKCKNDKASTNLNSAAKQMENAAQNLMGLYQDPSSLTSDPSALSSLQANVDQIFNGLTTFGDTLSAKAVLSDSECGSKIATIPGLITSMSDVVAQIAPLAIIAASLNPSWGTAAKIAVGAAGTTGVTKAISAMITQDVVDMENPENRLALLNNVCEFSKIFQRYRFLKLAQSGQIAELQQELGVLKTSMRNSVAKTIDPDLRDQINKRQQIAAKKQEIETKLKSEKRMLSRYQSQVSGTKANDEICAVGRELSLSEENAFPTITTQLHNEAASTNLTSSRRAQVVAADLARFPIDLSQVDIFNSEQMDRCVQLTRSYLRSISLAHQNLEESIRLLDASLANEARGNQGLVKAEQRLNLVNSEISKIDRVGKILEKLNQDNSVIDKNEIAIQMDMLKYSLFNRESLMSKPSPVRGWLEYNDQHFLRFGGKFEMEVKELQQMALDISRTGGSRYIVLSNLSNQTGYISKDQFNMYVLANQEQQAAEKLEPLNKDVIPAGTQQHTEVCRRLESAWIKYNSALDNLAAQEFMCRYIEPIFDVNVESGLVSICNPNIRIDGKIKQQSRIQQRFEKFQQKNGEIAGIVAKRLNDLNCSMPEISE